jgi:arsenical resistance protein ArsH
VVDAVEALMKFTLLTRNVSTYVMSRYGERKEEAEELEARVSLKVL